MSAAVWLLAIGVVWGAIIMFALSLARAAAKPAPKPEPVREFPALDDVTFDWPAVERAADASYRLGFEGGRAVQRIEDRRG